MAYDIRTYLRINDEVELERRFNNLELLIKPFKEKRDYLKRCLEDQIFLEKEIQKWEEKLVDLKEDMTNIATAIDIIKNDSEENEDE